MSISGSEVMLIKWLTDMIITAGTSLSRVGQMSEEEIKALLPEAEAESRRLMDILEKH